MVLLGLIFVAGLALLALIDRILLLKAQAPLREAHTSAVIDREGSWEGHAHRAAAQELVVRAEHGDRMAADFLFGRSRSNRPDLTGDRIPRPIPWRIWFPPSKLRPITVWSRETGFVKVIDRKADARRRCRYGCIGLVLLRFPLEDLEEHFEKVNNYLETTMALAGTAVVVVAYLLWDAFNLDPESFKKVTLRQLAFAYVRSPGAIRKAAETELTERATKDEEAKAFCLRLGILVRDPLTEQELNEPA